MGKSAEDYFKRGNEKFAQGDLNGAITDFTEAIRLNPNYADAYCNRGTIKERKGDLEEAIADFNKAIHINQNHADAYHNRGAVKGRKGDLDGAIVDFNKAIELNPNNAEAYHNRGKARRLKDDLDGAIDDFTKAIELNHDYELAYHNRGIVKEQKGELDGAIDDFTKAIDLNPNDVTNYRNRGTIRRQKGDLKEAIDDFTKTIVLAPNDATNYRNRGFARGEKGDFEEAIDDFNKVIIDLDLNDVKDYLGRGVARLGKGDFGKAIDDFSKAIDLDFNNVTAYRLRGIAKGQKEYFEEAIVDFNKAIDLDSNDALSYFYRGNAKRRSTLEGAIADYTEAINIKDDFAAAYAYRGLAKSERDNKEDLDEAITDFDKANCKNKNIAEYHPLLYIAQQTEKVFAEKDKKKRKIFFELFQKINNLQKKIATIKDYGKPPMHFTDLNTLRNLAQGERFRLYNSSLMHDKNEGKIFFEMLFKENTKIVNGIQKELLDEHSNNTFIGSFVMDSDDKDGDDLMWRVYGRHKGRERLGCAFVFDKGIFPTEPSSIQALLTRKSISNEDGKTETTDNDSYSENHVKLNDCFLYPVVYSDNKRIKKTLEVLGKSLYRTYQNIKKIKDPQQQKDMKNLVGGMLDLVRFLFKHKSYKREREARFVVWRRKDSGIVKRDPDQYIECPELNLERVILGFDVKNDKEWGEWLQEQDFFKGKGICIRKSGD